MSRRRDHHPRFYSHCPDAAACERLYHGTLGSGVEPGTTCECCGQLYEPDDDEPEDGPDA